MELILQNGTAKVEPDFFGSFDRVISRDEWASLSKTTPSIDVDRIAFQRLPPKVPDDTPVGDFLLYNPDRTADFAVFSYAQTPYARSEQGALVYVRGKGAPPLDGGWTILGRSYAEVWADPQKRALYNSIFPPGPNGEPRAVAVFQ